MLIVQIVSGMVNFRNTAIITEGVAGPAEIFCLPV